MVHEIHNKRRGRSSWSGLADATKPRWAESIRPRHGDLIIGKRGQSGFIGTDLDPCLKDRGIETLLVAGFSFKSCLLYTLMNAFQFNYRVVFLRDGTDPPGTNEFPDTEDSSLTDGGWVRLVLTRLIEDHLGYSSTCPEVARSCKEA
jgi:nicotinamidase-related amidase